MTSDETDHPVLEVEFSLATDVEPPQGVGSDDLEDLARHVLQAEGAVGSWHITVALVDDARLQALHRDFLGIDTPTDIMTFPLADSGQQPSGGELVISGDHATTEATVWGLTAADEIRFLVIHGLLHLLGWRDDSDDSRQRMLDRQTVLLDAWRSG